ncbi:MAG: histidine phosphatase family protein [Actinobacteria bacterium]|nr:histidine phosphatase family protein [Actinomycetota bacterium]
MVAVTRVYLVRHGRASAGWDTEPDPGLDDEGRRQAAATTEALSLLPDMPLVSSPLRRCRETAAFLSAKWKYDPVTIQPVVGEIPSPDGVPLRERVDWLRTAMAGTWADLGPRYTSFRDSVRDYVSSLSRDTVIFSHFIAINAVIGACRGDDRVVISRLDNASVTIIDLDVNGHATLVRTGRQADTLIR